MYEINIDMDKKKRIQQVIELLESGKIEFIIPKNFEVDYMVLSYDYSTKKDESITNYCKQHTDLKLL
jgi:hypothetical protein